MGVYTKIEECISENNFTEITVLEGEASGVDLIAKEWAIHNACAKIKFRTNKKSERYDCSMSVTLTL